MVGRQNSQVFCQMISSSKSTVRIGGLTTHAAVESSKELAKACSVLCECAGLIGDIQVRNAGTLGGAIAHADPAADWPAALIAARARSGRPMAERLSAELLDAYREQGSAIKKREDTLKMADANRAFAHYRW